MEAKTISRCMLLGFVCLCISITEVDCFRLKRQDITPQTPMPMSPTVPPDSPSSTQTFDQFLEDMFKELGIEVNNNDTSAEDYTTNGYGTDGTAVTAANGTLTTPTDYNVTFSTMYPQEDNISTTLSPDWLVTTATTETTLETVPTVLPSTSQLVDSVDTSFNDDNCRVDPKLADFCIIPDQLTDFIGPGATLHDLSNYLLSIEVVNKLVEKCATGTWCLNSFHAFRHLEDKITFWSNSSDFMNICWQPLDGCLRSVVDYFTGCPIYQMYDLIAETKKLLCEMKEEPKASRDCVEQTLKALHVSMADFHRDDNDIDQEATESCETREASMTANYLCARDVCGDYGDLLQQFKPWAWFMEGVSILEELCIYDNAKCTTQKEEEAAEEEEAEEAEITSSVWGTEQPSPGYSESSEVEEIIDTSTENIAEDGNAYATWVAEEIDVSTVLIVGALSVAGLGFFFLIGLVWCLKRKRSRLRIREGVEYMEILPDMDD